MSTVTYDWVKDGQVLAAASLTIEEGDALPGLNPAKGAWLPHLEILPDFDLAYEVLSGPVIVVGEDEVTYTWTKRDKTEAELGPLLEAKLAALEAEYRRRNALPFAASVEGVSLTWHGDDEGVTNIRDVIQGIVLGVVPNPRPWKPFEQDPVLVSHDGFRAIMIAYTSRKEANFGALQVLKATARFLAVTNAPALSAFDPTSGWV